MGFLRHAPGRRELQRIKPGLRSPAAPEPAPSESGVGLELLVALFRAFLPGISASTAVMSGSHRAEYSLSPILLS